MSIPQAFLDELRQRIALSSLIQETTALKRAGREWKACCPFHDEKSASFTVNDAKGFYHCFGCQAHGGAIDWMMQQRGLAFIDAVKELASRASMEMPARDPQQDHRDREREGLINLNQRASDWFRSNLQLDGACEARAYLEQRGISEASIDRFELGWAIPSRRGTGSLLAKGTGIDDIDALARLGLVRKSPDSDVCYDFFRQRLVIPIHDVRGGVIGFGARIIGAGEPKYLNSPDTPVFDKGNTLFNLHRAAPAARRERALIVVEGYLDVIALDAVGVDNVVAPNGTALTAAQLQKAWRLVNEPVLCFDGDPAGRKAAVRAARAALEIMEPGRSLRFACPPSGLDPDDVARQSGRAGVDEMIAAALPLIDVIWRDLLDRHDTSNPDQVAAMRGEARDLVRSIRNADLKASYGEALRSRFDAGRARQHHRSNNDRPAVSDAMQDAVMIGLIDHIDMIPSCADDLLGIRWVRPEHQKSIDLALELMDARSLDREQLLSGLSAAGIPDIYVAARARCSLRLPFTAETGTPQAIESLRATIRGLGARTQRGRK